MTYGHLQADCLYTVGVEYGKPSPYLFCMLIEIESLLVSCNELESRLDERSAELGRMRDVHACYREKMSRHCQLVEMSETSTTTKQQIDQLNDRIRKLTTDR